MPKTRHPKTATLDEVHIERNGNFALITFLDPNYASMRLEIGSAVKQMSDKEILDAFNQTVESMQECARLNPPVEIQEGNPQIKFDRSFKCWHPVGDVLRCELVEDNDEDLSISIDDKVLSFSEFKKMLQSYQGWGMRITFLHPTQLADPPEPVVHKKRPAPSTPSKNPPYPSVYS